MNVFKLEYFIGLILGLLIILALFYIKNRTGIKLIKNKYFITLMIGLMIVVGVFYIKNRTDIVPFEYDSKQFVRIVGYKDEFSEEYGTRVNENISDSISQEQIKELLKKLNESVSYKPLIQPSSFSHYFNIKLVREDGSYLTILVGNKDTLNIELIDSNIGRCKNPEDCYEPEDAKVVSTNVYKVKPELYDWLENFLKQFKSIDEKDIEF